MKEILYKLFEHQYLGRKRSAGDPAGNHAGQINDAQIASLITVFLMRSISVEELIGFREALLEMRIPVDLNEFEPIDIVGTGGDGKNTFNVSTCACFVVAGAGYPVVKHGNYGATSVSGASNVMEQHGVKFTADNDSLRRSLERCNIAYLHAPLFNPGAESRRPRSARRSAFAPFQHAGPVSQPGDADIPVARSLQPAVAAPVQLHVSGERDAIRRRAQPRRIRRDFADVGFQSGHAGQRKLYSPEELGFARCREADLYGGDTPEEAAAIFDRVLQGTATPAQSNCVIANAAFAIRVMRPEKSIDTCIAEARESLAAGKSPAYIRKIRRTEQLIR